MNGQRARLGQVLSKAAARTLASWDPISASPAAGLETSAALDAFGPSPRPRLAAAGVVAGAGLGLAYLPERSGETVGLCVARSGGILIGVGAISGAIYDLAVSGRGRRSAPGTSRLLLTSLTGLAGVTLIARERLHGREEVIQKWTEQDKPAELAGSALVAQGVTLAGAGLARAFARTGQASIRFFGDDPAHQVIARAANLAGWAAAASLLYHAGISYIGRDNEKIEPAYAEPPVSPLRSGSPHSKAPFSELGREGRRYVTDVVTPDLIEKTLGEPAVAEPIRAYVGFNTEPLYSGGRAELARDELERMGAFDRSYLLLVSPTGTGWVDQTMISSAELLTRGDIATCAIQYGRFPSFLCWQKVPAGRQQFRALLWGVKERLASLPAERRPKVLVFGESLGAWASSDICMRNGVAGLDGYGVARALWFGLPGLAVWSKTGMKEGRSPLAPAGTVGHFDRYEQLAALTQVQRERLRVVVLDHDNDPIASLSPRLLVARPDWLRAGRGRGVPASMGWIPLITFVHTAFDLPPVAEEQMQAVEQVLRKLELDRGQRIKASQRAPGQDRPPGGRRTAGARWRRSFQPNYLQLSRPARRVPGRRWRSARRAPAPGRAGCASGAAARRTRPRRRPSPWPRPGPPAAGRPGPVAAGPAWPSGSTPGSAARARGRTTPRSA